MAVEVEDDVFFADLSKQISLLIMDDEEEFPVQYQHLIIGQVSDWLLVLLLQHHVLCEFFPSW